MKPDKDLCLDLFIENRELVKEIQLLRKEIVLITTASMKKLKRSKI